MIKSNKTILLIPLFEEFITKTQRGKRLRKDGRQISQSSITSYKTSCKLLARYEQHIGKAIEVPLLQSTAKRSVTTLKNYWERFYRDYTAFLFKQGYIDNYVGLQFKMLRTFFNYLTNEKQLNIGQYHKSFYIRKEDTPIVVLNQDQLQSLMHDEDLYCNRKTNMYHFRQLTMSNNRKIEM